MVRIPKKLRNPPIVEAIFEVRFSSSEISEVVIGNLASCELWRDFEKVRLPLADVPESMRERDPNLIFQPILQLQAKDGLRIVKIGSRVFSFHAVGAYPGWTRFEPDLLSATKFIYDKLADVAVTRLGFRYLNILTKAHLIESMSDLNFKVQLNGAPLGGPINLNYQRGDGAAHHAVVRVASREFVTNPAADLVALIDVDIFTPPGFKSAGQQETQKWVSAAHDLLKQEFFTLLPEAIIEKLEEK